MAAPGSRATISSRSLPSAMSGPCTSGISSAAGARTARPEARFGPSHGLSRSSAQCAPQSRPGPSTFLVIPGGAMLAMEWFITKSAGQRRESDLRGRVPQRARVIEDANALIATFDARVASRNRAGRANGELSNARISGGLHGRLGAAIPRAQRDTREQRVPRAGARGRRRGSLRKHGGPSEFKCTGVVKNFDRTADLPSLRLPVLFHSGNSTSAVRRLRRHAALTPGAEFVVIPNAAHLTMIDAPGASNDAVRAFLARVDRH